MQVYVLFLVGHNKFVYWEADKRYHNLFTHTQPCRDGTTESFSINDMPVPLQYKKRTHSLILRNTYAFLYIFAYD